ncbi:MAG: hypothetical protein J6A47_05025, partial [Bacilli bacterium]|nr:hypothetical protein [Bacilli bacterium]
MARGNLVIFGPLTHRFQSLKSQSKRRRFPFYPFPSPYFLEIRGRTSVGFDFFLSSQENRGFLCKTSFFFTVNVAENPTFISEDSIRL